MLRIDYRKPEAAARQILEWLEERLDEEHQSAVVARRLRALRWQPIDRAPVTIAAPAAEPFRIYPYHEAFEDPAKMLVNELVGPGLVWGAASPSIVNSVLLHDDFPLQIRPNYGIGVIASLFGANVRVVEDNMPWVEPLGREVLERAVKAGPPDLHQGLLPDVMATMEFYQIMLGPHPRCREAIHVTQPDLQGPFDIAAQLWGSPIFMAFQDHPEFLRALLELIGDTYVRASRACATLATDYAAKGIIYLHFTLCKGNCLLKDDSSILLSPRTYEAFIRPANERVLGALRGGGIHWCGSGQHWRPEFIATEGLECIDWGNPERLDLPIWEALLRERRIPVAQMQWQAEQFLALRPDRAWPTGAAFTVSVRDLDEAREVLDRRET